MRRLPTHAHAHNSILTFRDLLMRRMIMWVCVCVRVRVRVCVGQHSETMGFGLGGCNVALVLILFASKAVLCGTADPGDTLSATSGETREPKCVERERVCVCVCTRLSE